jgi:hypothetical protein
MTVGKLKRLRLCATHKIHQALHFNLDRLEGQILGMVIHEAASRRPGIIRIPTEGRLHSGAVLFLSITWSPAACHIQQVTVVDQAGTAVVIP